LLILTNKFYVKHNPPYGRQMQKLKLKMQNDNVKLKILIEFILAHHYLLSSYKYLIFDILIFWTNYWLFYRIYFSNIEILLMRRFLSQYFSEQH